MINRIFTVYDEITSNEMEVYINDKNKIVIKVGSDLYDMYDTQIISLDLKDINELIKELNALKKLL
jgi:hypothetical protein